MKHTRNYRLAFIGNCQMVGLCQYISWLSDEYMAYWICLDEFLTVPWPKNVDTFGSEQICRNIFDKNRAKEILQTCDIVIYQANFQSIKLIDDNCPKYVKRISMSFINFDKIDAMKRKENKYNTSIKISSIYEKHPSKKLHLKNTNHPTTLVLLEIVKEICTILKLPFYDNETYAKLMDKQYPRYK